MVVARAGALTPADPRSANPSVFVPPEPHFAEHQGLLASVSLVCR